MKYVMLSSSSTLLRLFQDVATTPRRPSVQASASALVVLYIGEISYSAPESAGTRTGRCGSGAENGYLGYLVHLGISLAFMLEDWIPSCHWFQRRGFPRAKSTSPHRNRPVLWLAQASPGSPSQPLCIRVASTLWSSPPTAVRP